MWSIHSVLIYYEKILIWIVTPGLSTNNSLIIVKCMTRSGKGFRSINAKKLITWVFPNTCTRKILHFGVLNYCVNTPKHNSGLRKPENLKHSSVERKRSQLRDQKWKLAWHDILSRTNPEQTAQTVVWIIVSTNIYPRTYFARLGSVSAQIKSSFSYLGLGE